MFECKSSFFSLSSLIRLVKRFCTKLGELHFVKMKFFATLLAISHSYETPNFGSHPAVGKLPYTKTKRVLVSRCLEKYGPIDTSGKNVQIECNPTNAVWRSECRVKCLESYQFGGVTGESRWGTIACLTTEDESQQQYVKGLNFFPNSLKKIDSFIHHFALLL